MICSSDNINWPTSIVDFFFVQFYKDNLLHFDTKFPYDVSFEFRLGSCFKRGILYFSLSLPGF